VGAVAVPVDASARGRMGQVGSRVVRALTSSVPLRIRRSRPCGELHAQRTLCAVGGRDWTKLTDEERSSPELRTARLGTRVGALGGVRLRSFTERSLRHRKVGDADVALDRDRGGLVSLPLAPCGVRVRAARNDWPADLRVAGILGALQSGEAGRTVSPRAPGSAVSPAPKKTHAAA
jgi:hypothetical protein